LLFVFCIFLFDLVLVFGFGCGLVLLAIIIIIIIIIISLLTTRHLRYLYTQESLPSVRRPQDVAGAPATPTPHAVRAVHENSRGKL
jgi:hypothetical protein